MVRETFPDEFIHTSIRIIGFGAALIALASPLFAQSPNQTDTLVLSGECEVAPLAEGAPPPDAAPETLSETLAPCDGVLRPAPVGDKDLIIAPPEGGETPIIEPEELPPQPPAAE